MAAPSTANISIKVSGKTVHINPPNFISLTLERLAGDACNKFTLQILDTDGYELEYSLINYSGGSIEINYTDYSKNISKHFAGYVIEVDDAFHQDRMMLTLRGFVGLSLQNMYDRYSVAWNVVPKFKWSDVFSDASGGLYDNNGTSATTNDQNSDDGFFENIGNWFKNLGGTTVSAFAYLINFMNNGFDLEYLTYRSLNAGGDPEGTLSGVLDNIKVDKAGNYYLPNRKAGNNYKVTDTESKHNIKQSGSIIIPIKPSKLIKLIARGGYYSELLEDDFENYKGTSFYNGDNKISEIDWIFIKLWFKRMGKFPGCGWNCNDADIEDTDMKEVDFTQSNMSFTKFINDVVLKNCTKTETTTTYKNNKGVSYVMLSPTYGATVTTTTVVKSNYYFYLDEKSSAHLKRVDITNDPKDMIKRTYFLYGDNRTTNFQEQAFGHLTAFNANNKVLTALIAKNAVPEYNISNKNLVTGEENPDVKEEIDASDEEENLEVFSGWGDIKMTVVNGSRSGSGGDKAVSTSEVQSEAYKQSYEATATIIGTCGLAPQDYIQIIVIPKGNTIKHHHTSGYYYILKITETIKDGTISSELQLIKNVGSIGKNNGVVSVKVKETKYDYNVSM